MVHIMIWSFCLQVKVTQMIIKHIIKHSEREELIGWMTNLKAVRAKKWAIEITEARILSSPTLNPSQLSSLIFMVLLS